MALLRSALATAVRASWLRAGVNKQIIPALNSAAAPFYPLVSTAQTASPFLSTVPRSFATEVSAGEVQQIVKKWDEIADSMPDENSRREITAIRNKFISVTDNLMAQTKLDTKIDWAYYDSKIEDKEVLKAFKEFYDSYKPSPPDTSVIDKLDKDLAALEAKANADAEEAKKEIAKIEAELEKIEEEMARLETMRVDDALDANPDLKKQINDEIKRMEF